MNMASPNPPSPDDAALQDLSGGGQGPPVGPGPGQGRGRRAGVHAALEQGRAAAADGDGPLGEELHTGHLAAWQQGGTPASHHPNDETAR